MAAAVIQMEGLVTGRILRRYQRFLADVCLDDGRVVTAHCTNTGTMRSCWEPQDPVLLRVHTDPKRKLPYTWMACQRGGTWVGVDTGMPNRVVAEALRQDCMPGLPGLGAVRTEVAYGQERSRIDVHALDPQGRQVFIEVKNTTLREGDEVAFPDAVTTRGTKHLRELQAMVRQGHRAALVFFVHRNDVQVFTPARHIDPDYAEELDRARQVGVEILPLAVRLEVQGAGPQVKLAWHLDGLLPYMDRVEGP